jgi:hypothetical protein
MLDRQANGEPRQASAQFHADSATKAHSYPTAARGPLAATRPPCRVMDSRRLMGDALSRAIRASTEYHIQEPVPTEIR